MVRLLPLTPEVHIQVLLWAEKPELREYFRRSPPIMDWATTVDKAMGWCYVIYEDLKPVGIVQLLNQESQARSIETAVMVDKDLCSDRKLVSLQIYKQIAQYIFFYMDYNKMYMKILAHREKLASRLKSGNWIVEARLRRSCKFEGQLVDELVLGLLKEDYKLWVQEQQEQQEPQALL